MKHVNRRTTPILCLVAAGLFLSVTAAEAVRGRPATPVSYAGAERMRQIFALDSVCPPGLQATRSPGCCAWPS